MAERPRSDVLKSWQATSSYKQRDTWGGPSLLWAPVAHILIYCGAAVAQCVKCWPADLAVPEFEPLWRWNLLIRKWGCIAQTFHYHLPIILVWLKYCWNGCKIANHPPAPTSRNTLGGPSVLWASMGWSSVCMYSCIMQYMSAHILRSPGSSVGLALAYWSSSAEFETRLRQNLFSCKWGSIAHSLSLSSAHCPDMTEILFEKDVKSQIIHPSVRLMYCIYINTCILRPSPS